MSQPPAGAQLSEDGAYWWDDQSQQWQLVDSGAGTSSSEAGPSSSSAPDASGAQLSEDGNYRWDGSQWQPVDGGSGEAGGASGAEGAGGTGGAAGGLPEGYVTIPDDLLSMLQNLDNDVPEMAALAQVGDGETYLASNLGVPVPDDDGTAYA